MRLVHTIDSGGFYGAERVVLDLMELQRDRDAIEPALLDFVDAGHTTSELGRRVTAVGGAVRSFPVKRGASLGALRGYAQTLHAMRADIVHSHGYKPTFFHVVSGLLRLHRVPLVISAHGYSRTSPTLREKLYEKLDRWMLSRADAVVAVSGEMASYLTARSPRLPLRTIPNGIDTGLSPRGSHPLRLFLADHGIATDSVVIGSVGRLVPMKNHQLLVDAFSELQRELPCVLVILGDGPLRPALEAQWRAAMPDMEPLLVPHQSDVLEWIQDMDIFCQPSGPGEGLPMALLEAGFLARAVVCSDSGGMADLVQHGENAIGFRMGDRKGLVDGLRALVRDAALRRRLGEALHQTIVTEHDSRTVEVRYWDVYSDVRGPG